MPLYGPSLVGSSVLSAFTPSALNIRTEHLKPGTTPDVIQLGAFYALFTIYFTQIDLDQMPKQPLRLTLSTLNHLLSLPQATPGNTEDTIYLLSRFFHRGTLVYILPDSLKDDPVLPTNRISAQGFEASQMEIGKLATAVQSEIEHTSTGPTSDLNNDQPKSWASDYLDAQQVYLASRDAALQTAGPAGLDRYLAKGQQRLVGHHPTLFDLNTPYLGRHGELADQLDRTLNSDLPEAVKITQHLTQVGEDGIP